MHKVKLNISSKKKKTTKFDLFCLNKLDKNSNTIVPRRVTL